MEIPQGYSVIPGMFLVAGTKTPVNIYIYMPMNKNLIHFRKKGEELTVTDALKLKELSGSQVLTPTEEYNVAIHQVSKFIVFSPSPKGQPSKEAKAVSDGIMLSLTGKEETVTLESARKILDETADLVQQVLTTYRPMPQSNAFEKMLATLKQNDPIMNHNRHVGALTGVLMFSVGGFSMDEIADASYAGFIHDFCLPSLPQVLVDRHLQADDLTQSASKSPELGYARHIEFILNKVRDERIPVTPGTLKVIEHHHENFDGTGLKGLPSARIFRPARVLRIADDLICLVNHTENPRTLKTAVEELWSLSAFGRNVYDPEMLKLIRSAIFSQSAAEPQV